MTLSAWVGVTLIVGTIGFAIYGGWRGAIRQIGSVAGFLFGYLAAQLFAPGVAQQLALPTFAVYCLVFALVYVLVMVLCRVLKLTVKMLLLGAFDRMLGAIIGVAKWLVLTSLLLNLFIICGVPDEMFSGRVTQWVIAFLPRLFGLAQNYL